MLGSESIEEMFDQPGWSEEEVEDADEKDINAHSESLLSHTDKNKQFVADDEVGKDVNGKIHLSFYLVLRKVGYTGGGSSYPSQTL